MTRQRTGDTIGDCRRAGRAAPEGWQSRDNRRGVQTAFVDEPRAAVEQADALVAEVMQQLTDGFARERAGLERQWSGGQDVSTEELRLAIRRYRSFFDRLLSL